MSRRLPPLAVAAGLALGAAVSLGLARFSYALLLPPMRADLGWSYLTAGAMNTANAAGYLCGALLAPWAIRRYGARAMFLGGGWATALLLALHGLVLGEASLAGLRFMTGIGSAATFICGGLLAARLAGAPLGKVLGIYYGGTGLGIVVSTLLVPALAGRSLPHAWQGAWLALGGVALMATALMAAATRPASDVTHSAPPPPLQDPAHALPTSGRMTLAEATVAPAAAFSWRLFAPALLAYLLFGLGYIGYMTFSVTLLREQGLAAGVVDAFFAMLGLAVIASSWLWAGLLQRFRGGESLAVLNGLVAAATALPVLSTHPAAVFASGLLFGAVFLSVVASTTALVRHNLPAAHWPAGITAFTIVFAFGQIVGPVLVGAVGDAFGGLRAGLAVSAGVLALAAVVAIRQKPLAAVTIGAG